jgi:transcriptional regulator with PAS, ATPase and Fis domain
MPDDPDTTRGASMPSLQTGAGRWVLVTVGAGDLRAVPLPVSGELVVGRDADCDVVLDHSRVSRRHARLRVDAGNCVIEDLGSHNGTRVGEPLAPNKPHALQPGDAIGIGPFMLIVVREPTPAPTSSLVIDDPTAATPSAVLTSVARSPASVLIRGETGAGKQVLAETLHRLSGRSGKLLSLNCAAIGGELLESELFGHERGAFTGAVAAKAGLLEVAAGGTVLLDEIGDMAPALQAKLLRAVENREILRVGSTAPIAIDVRFLSATHRDLLASVETGTFRLDLYYRLAAVTLSIPPLRARRGRIVAMASELLALATRGRRAAPTISAAAAAKLQTHDWPGNVRELRNVLDRALILVGDAASIDAAHIAFDAAPLVPASTAAVASPASGGDDTAERARIVAALEQCSGNQTRAAKVLGISRSTLATKLAIHRIPRPRK